MKVLYYGTTEKKNYFADELKISTDCSEKFSFKQAYKLQQG